MLCRRLFFAASSSGGGRFSLRGEYTKLVQMALPERNKYLKNVALTLAHATIFMYLPNIYGDINMLMNLKQGINTTQ